MLPRLSLPRVRSGGWKCWHAAVRAASRKAVHIAYHSPCCAQHTLTHTHSVYAPRSTTVFADVPGLLEGAHEGLGLGHEFLRHVQRCRVLVHVVDGTSPDPVGDFNAINLELELFNPDLKDKPQLVAYNKVGRRRWRGRRWRRWWGRRRGRRWGRDCEYAQIPLMLSQAHKHVRHAALTTPPAAGVYFATLFCIILPGRPPLDALQVDIPDSGDFWEMVREQLTTELGVPADRIFPISAATGQGVIELVGRRPAGCGAAGLVAAWEKRGRGGWRTRWQGQGRVLDTYGQRIGLVCEPQDVYLCARAVQVRAVRGVLDELGPQQLTYETNALNQTAVQRREVRIDDFTVAMEDLPPGSASTAPRVFYVEGEGIERFAQVGAWERGECKGG